MDYIKNLVEYYDELFPVSEEQFVFYQSLLKEYSKPLKFLGIGCGTGILENRLAKELSDVTGIETIKELLNTMDELSTEGLKRNLNISSIDTKLLLNDGLKNEFEQLNENDSIKQLSLGTMKKNN